MAPLTIATLVHQLQSKTQKSQTRTNPQSFPCTTSLSKYHNTAPALNIISNRHDVALSFMFFNRFIAQANQSAIVSKQFWDSKKTEEARTDAAAEVVFVSLPNR